MSTMEPGIEWLDRQEEGAIGRALAPLTLFENTLGGAQAQVPEGGLLVFLGVTESCMEVLWNGGRWYILNAINRGLVDLFGL